MIKKITIPESDPVREISLNDEYPEVQLIRL